MLRAILLFAALLPLKPAPDLPAYTPDGSLRYPATYSEWVFLGVGLDMSYSSDTPAVHSVFNSVFVNPSAWSAFKQTGHWPDGTVMVLENRAAAAGAAAINKRGKTESEELTGLEVHVKDSSHAPGDGWAFFIFARPADPASAGKLLPRPANCYTCHEQHGSVDTTFTQFYPAALAIARAKSTYAPPDPAPAREPGRS